MANGTAWRGLAAAPDGLACDEFVRVLRSNAGLSEQSERRLVQVICRFLRYLDGAGISSLTETSPAAVRDFVLAPSDTTDAAPSVATSHLRRSAVRLLFRVLRQMSLVEHDPTLDLALPPRSSLQARPLSDDEIALGRSFSLYSLTETRRPAAWALAEASARTSEIPNVCVRDLDLDAGRVWLGGGTKVEPRWASLTTWGTRALERRLETIGTDPDTPLVYEGRGSLESRQASTCDAISETLRRAGLAAEPDVRPLSVTAWAGRKVLDETGRIDAVARALGMRSLDRAATLIGFDWTDGGLDT
jgi:integrase/recombinase XerC